MSPVEIKCMTIFGNTVSHLSTLLHLCPPLFRMILTKMTKIDGGSWEHGLGFRTDGQVAPKRE